MSEDAHSVESRLSRRQKPVSRRSARPRRTQEERSAETRSRLVAAAIRVLHDSGYANLTISKVAQQAGLTNGAMQHHFVSREELVLAVLDAVYPVLEIPFEHIAAQRLSIRERTGTVVDLLWQIYSKPEYLVIWDIAFGSRGDRALKAKLQAYQRDIAARMRKNLAMLFADINLSQENANTVFSLVISYLRGLALQTVFGTDRNQADLEQIKEVACERIRRLSAKQR